MLKRRLIATIEHVRAELNDAITAIESDDVDTAVEKLRSISERIRDHVKELRSTP